MEVSVVKIGNSKGIRLAKSLLERYNIHEKVELIPEKGQIVLRPIEKPREGWDEKFEQMHQEGDDQLLMDDIFEDEAFDEWK